MTKSTVSKLSSLRQRCAARTRLSGDRGDVPGWVLVTIMTAGLVVTLWAVAGTQLADLFSNAVSSVHGK